MNIETIIEEKLLSAFTPKYLDVVNKSKQLNSAVHHNKGNQFFKVIIISEVFAGEGIRKRHKAVNSVLSVELTEDISQLVLHPYTEHEWENYYANSMSLSPHCLF